MGELLCTEHRCNAVQQVITEINTTRCGDNSTTVEYWQADNAQDKNLSEMKFCSGGKKLPDCNSHAVSDTYEGLAIGQSVCEGHRAGSGTLIKTTNKESIVLGGKNSFISQLYVQINKELAERRKHSIYASLSDNFTKVPNSNEQIFASDLNDALNAIKKYYDIANSDLNNYNYTEVSTTEIVKKSNLDDLKNKFNATVINDCICYSDCQGYAMCYCYGNCNYY